MNKLHSSIRRKRKIKKTCQFCLKNDDSAINYFNISLLALSLTSKGCIKSRFSNQACGKHQRKIRKNIIIARNLHLLPYILQ